MGSPETSHLTILPTIPLSDAMQTYVQLQSRPYRSLLCLGPSPIVSTRPWSVRMPCLLRLPTRKPKASSLQKPNWSLSMTKVALVSRLLSLSYGHCLSFLDNNLLIFLPPFPTTSALYTLLHMWCTLPWGFEGFWVLLNYQISYLLSYFVDFPEKRLRMCSASFLSNFSLGMSKIM